MSDAGPTGPVFTFDEEIMEIQNNANHHKHTKMTMAQIFKLGQELQATYTDSKLHDAEYAEMVSKKLGFTVTETMVGGLRRQLGMESTYKRLARERAERERAEEEAQRILEREALKQAEPLLVIERIQKLETKIEVLVDGMVALEKRVTVLELFAKALQANRHQN